MSSETKWVRATRTFDQSLRGESYLVSADDPYWNNMILAGNVEVLESTEPSPLDELFADEEDLSVFDYDADPEG